MIWGYPYLRKTTSWSMLNTIVASTYHSLFAFLSVDRDSWKVSWGMPLQYSLRRDLPFDFVVEAGAQVGRLNPLHHGTPKVCLFLKRIFASGSRSYAVCWFQTPDAPGAIGTLRNVPCAIGNKSNGRGGVQRWNTKGNSKRKCY